MEKLPLKKEEDFAPAIAATIRVFEQGGSVIFPTDTLYALGCNALEPVAVGRLFDIKRRTYTAAIPVLVRDLLWARELVSLDVRAERLASAHWPGRLTIVARRTAMVPAMTAGGGQTLGVRAPDHPFVQRLLQTYGYPLCGTSANLSGQDSSQNPARIVAQFDGLSRVPDLLLDAGILPPSEPSTVVDVSGVRSRITRQGAIRADHILPYLT
jgi:L-threonylcarbamoyladenylate synthase